VTTLEQDGGPPEPRANSELLDREAAEQTLLRAFRSRRLPHAWLLSGARGLGKATLAYRFARFVLAEPAGQGADLFGAPPTARKDLYLDPASDVFRRVAAGGHPDLRSLEIGADPRTGRARREILVDDVRKIGHFLRMTSSEGGWRVVVVDSIDYLNRNAANALLKVLEEPPERALLILVSHAPGSLLATIRSRCCQLPIAPLSEVTVAQLMERFAPDLGPEDRAALVGMGEGSIGRALDLAAGGGLELYRELLSVLEDLPRLDVAKVHALGDRLAKGGDETAFRTGMELLIWWLARTIRGAAEGRPPGEILAGEGALAARLAAGPGLARWLPLWDKITQLFAQAGAASLDRKQVVIAALLELEAATATRP
jgi:DNA polymerase III subunit delta'